MRTMQHKVHEHSASEAEVVDLAEVADDIYAYELETARRAAGGPGPHESPSTLAFEPDLCEFTD